MEHTKSTKTQGYLWSFYTDKPATNGTGRLVSGMANRTMVSGYNGKDYEEALVRLVGKLAGTVAFKGERTIVWVDGYRPTGPATKYVSSTSNQGAELVAGIVAGTVSCWVVGDVVAGRVTRTFDTTRRPLWVARALAATDTTPEPTVTATAVVEPAGSTLEGTADAFPLPTPEDHAAMMATADDHAAMIANLPDVTTADDPTADSLATFHAATVAAVFGPHAADDDDHDGTHVGGCRECVKVRIGERAAARAARAARADTTAATAAANRQMARGI